MAKKTKVAPTTRPVTQRAGGGGDWRGRVLARLRALILDADPEIAEEVKWRKPTNPAGVPVWSRGGIVCTGETHKAVVKLTFARGAELDDRARLFNASLDGNARRAINIREGDEIDEAAFKDLVRAAVALNRAGKLKREKPKQIELDGSEPKKGNRKPAAAAGPKLLSGDNPQIAKGYGDGPVQAYIAAIPGWKQDVARRLDAIIVRAVPGVRKAVKWNSPMYGVEGEGRRDWFLGIHCFSKYVKVAFFRGASLRPLPPGPSKQKEVRYLDVHQHDALDEAQFADWAKQASLLPGERM